MKSSWQLLDFEDVFEDITRHFVKIATNDYKTEGLYPIIDQSQQFIAGYTDLDLPEQIEQSQFIVFGDHTRVFKFIDFKFFIGADGVKVLKPKIESDTKYLYQLLNSLVIENNGYSRHFKFLKRHQILVPPLAEQKRIAAILDKADEIRRKREQTIAKLDQLAQSIFVEMFADDFMSSKQQISDFFSINDNRFEMNKDDKDLIPFIAMSSVSESLKRVIVNEHRLFSDVKKGYTPIKFADLIVAKITPCYENGKMAIVDSIDDDYAFGSTEFHTFRSSNPALTTLLYYYLKQPKVMFTGARKMKGAAGQKRVPDTFFRSLPFFIPPKSKLELFNDSIRIIKCEISLANEALAKQTQLFASLQHQAFTGQL